jgi:predicted nucleic acid-binding protein
LACACARPARRANATAAEELARGTVIFDIPILTGIVRDPNDEIVRWAVAVIADFLDSRDKDLLTLGSYESSDMVTPESFLHILRDEKPI